MKTLKLASVLCIHVAALVLGLADAAAALPVFTDDFSSGPSPLWGNEVGAWTVTAGAYSATLPNNLPNAYSSLPFNLTDFSVDFDVQDVMDGGIFLRMTPAPGTTFGVQGILLNLKVPDGGPKIYWHIFNGDTASAPLNISYLDYGNNPHVHIEVSGDTYSAFLNGSATPATTLVASDYASGRIALYDFSSQAFDNVVLTPVPEPVAGLLWGAGLAGLLLWHRRQPRRSEPRLPRRPL